jgi:hypothetical protein
MLDDKVSEDTIKLLLLDLCKVMHSYGYKKVRMGNIMRLLGMDSESAGKYDDDYIEFNHAFEELIHNTEQSLLNDTTIPSGTTIH